jgi:hypothetical protein
MEFRFIRCRLYCSNRCRLYCSNVAQCLDGRASHPCSTSCSRAFQGSFSASEAVARARRKAQILLVGSNPSVGDDEYALWLSPADQI